MDELTPEEFDDYATRRLMFSAFEKAKDGETGIAYLRQLVAHPLGAEVVVAHVFYYVDALDQAPWPVNECGTFWSKDEVPDYLGDMWGQWVG